MPPISQVPFSLAIFTAISACTIFPESLVERGVARLEIDRAPPIHISNAPVYRDDDETVVRGEVRFPIWAAFGMFTGHVDVSIVMPDGTVIDRHDIRVIRERIPKKHGRRGRFIARFKIDPAKGTIIRVSYREGKHGDARL